MKILKKKKTFLNKKITIQITKITIHSNVYKEQQKYNYLCVYCCTYIMCIYKIVVDCIVVVGT